MTNIGSSAFEYSTVTSLDLGDASASIGSRAFYACNITSLDLGNVTSIADYAFSVNLYLQSIVIPDSVTSIGDYAFGFCGFNTVDLGNGVTTIGSRAFYYNAEYSNTFTTVDIPSSVPRLRVRFSVIAGNWLQLIAMEHEQRLLVLMQSTLQQGL